MLAITRRAVVDAHKQRIFARQKKHFSTPAEEPAPEQHSKLHQGIQRDLKRGNLWELAQMKKHPDGKIWPSREVLAEQKIMWPAELNVVKSSGLVFSSPVNVEELCKTSPATFILVTQKRPFAVQQIESWTLPLREKHPDLPIIDLTISKNYGYKLITPVLSKIWDLRNTINATFGYASVSGIRNLTTNEFGIDVENGFLSYQFVLDSNMAIRWQSVGSSGAGEIERVSVVIKRLQAEFSSKNRQSLESESTSASKKTKKKL